MHKPGLTLTLALSPSVQADRRLTRRGTNTRDRILDATIACIVRSGFAAMTVENVMAEAGISRGSGLHQFPTRIARAIATADRAIRVVLAEALAMATKIEDPFTRLANYAQIAWDTHSMPEGLALTDILLAARWDAELLAGVQQMTARVEIEAGSDLIALATEAGIENPAVMVPRIWPLVSSARGLIIENSLGPKRPLILEALAEMKRSHRRYCESQRAPARRIGTARR